MDYSTPSTPEQATAVAKCCMNPACNCICFYIHGQIHASQTHAEHHCKDCGRCLCDHTQTEILHEPRRTPGGKIKCIPGQIPAMIQAFITPGCTNTTPPPPAEDWVQVLRKM